MADYAQGYTREDAPARMTEAILSAEAYGVKSTATDMIRVREGQHEHDPAGRKAAAGNHRHPHRLLQGGRDDPGLIWEQYVWPAGLETLLKGNSNDMIAQAASGALTPPQKPRTDVWVNKTGSTNGFGAYLAFIPERKLGVVILANKNYPNEDRVRIAYQVFTGLGAK